MTRYKKGLGLNGIMEKRPFGLVVVLLILLTLAFGVVHYAVSNEKPLPVIVEKELNYFNSEKELRDYVATSAQNEAYGLAESFDVGIKTATTNIAPSGAVKQASAESAADYSQTNIQVAGVDEPDIVKNDGKYIYYVKGSNMYIVEAYPAEDMRIINSLNMSSYISNIFVSDEKLVVFIPGYEVSGRGEACPLYGAEIGGVALKEASSVESIRCGEYGKSVTRVHVYDLKDKENLKMVYNASIDGDYVDSRLIGDYLYTITNKYIYLGYEGIDLPAYSINGEVKSVPVTEIGYFRDYDSSYGFTSIASLSIKNGNFGQAVFMTGGSDVIYVSNENVYLTRSMYIDADDSFSMFVEEVALPLMPVSEDLKIKTIAVSELKPAWQKQAEVRKIIDDYSLSLEGQEKQEFDERYAQLLQDYSGKLAKEREKTRIHKIMIRDGQISYGDSGVVPGTVLNQFSMDEYKGKFRIATTTGQVWGGNSLNHLYILNEDMSIIGKVEDLAYGEKIYSVRFIGGRAYMVTFKKVDPLFVIDVSKPENPKVLGYLKVKGFSDYLHSYDEEHIIGIGKEATGGEENFAWYQGLKISVFDVSDVENPIETAKIVIGDRGTDSEVLYNHKAFLFDKEKNLMVMPITLHEINESLYNGEIKDSTYGQEVWQGAYVFDITERDISVKGRVTHRDDESLKTCRDYTDWQTGKLIENCYWPYELNIRRSLYMDDVLYTISDGMIKANDLKSIVEIEEVNLPLESYYGREYGGGLVI